MAFDAGFYFRHVERKRLLYQSEQVRGAKQPEREESGLIPPATENCFAKAHRQNPERGGWLGGCGTLGNCSQEAPSVWTENLQIVPSSQRTMYWLFV
jgi:hypothetical protein